MQLARTFLPVLALSALVSTASAESGPEAACEQLRSLLTRELGILQSVQDAASASAAVAPLAEALSALEQMDRSYEAEKALWTYIDNTAGVKQPLIELLQLLTIEFSRLQKASFYGCGELEAQLTPQLHGPEQAENAQG